MTRLFAACAVILLAGPVSAFDLTAMTDAEQDAFGAQVRAYLLEHPEVLAEAIQVLDQRQAAAQVGADVSLVKSNAASIFEDGYSWVGGNPNGDITLVEFMDYRCGYCKKAYGEVAELIASDGNIRFVVKELPILGDQSVLAARFAIAVQQVAGDAAYETTHDALMTFRGDVTPATLEALAVKLGVDGPAIMAAMGSPAVSKVIADNQALADKMQISGTPTFVLADQMVRGYVPLAAMQEMVGQVRAE